MEGLRQAPSFLLACVFGASIALSPSLGPMSMAVPALLAALGLALGRRGGFVIAAVACGLLLGAAHRDELADAPLGLDDDRPVVVLGTIASHPRCESGSCAELVDTELFVQRDRVRPLQRSIRLETPAGVPPPSLGARIRAVGFLRRSPPLLNEDRSPPGPWRLRIKAAPFLEVVESPGPLDAIATRLRRRVEIALAAAPPGHPGTALARALVLGDPSRLPEDWRRGLRRAGLAHLVAVNGLHVGLLVALVVVLGAFAPAWARHGVAIAAIGLYAALVGPLPALARASTMTLLAVGGLALLRPARALQTLGVAILAALAAAPVLVFNLPFQLTIAATAGLVGWGPRIAGALAFAPRFVARSIGVSLGAQLATFPLVAARFSWLPVAAPLWNLAAVPWLALAIAGSFAWVSAAILLPNMGTRCLPALDLLAAPLAMLAALPPTPWLGFPFVVSPIVATALVGIFVAALGSAERRVRLLVVGALALATAGPSRAAYGARDVEAFFVDVGQGDAMLLFDGDVAILVDGGGGSGRDTATQALLPLLARRGIVRLAAVVATHGDLDHCGGLLDVVARLPVDTVWLPREPVVAPCLAALAREAGSRARLAGAGDRLETGRFRITALNPSPHEKEARENDQSIVLRVEAGERALLLAADIEAAAESDLVRRGAPLRTDVLKVPHHGSKTSSTPGFVAAARPKIAIVSVGARNRYGHPSVEVLTRYVRAPALLLRTDRSGGIDLLWRTAGPFRLQVFGDPP